MNVTEFSERYGPWPFDSAGASRAIRVAEYEPVRDDADIQLPSHYEAAAGNAWPNRDCVWIGDYITVPTCIS